METSFNQTRSTATKSPVVGFFSKVARGFLCHLTLVQPLPPMRYKAIMTVRKDAHESICDWAQANDCQIVYRAPNGWGACRMEIIGPSVDAFTQISAPWLVALHGVEESQPAVMVSQKTSKA